MRATRTSRQHRAGVPKKLDRPPYSIIIGPPGGWGVLTPYNIIIQRQGVWGGDPLPSFLA